LAVDAEKPESSTRANEQRRLAEQPSTHGRTCSNDCGGVVEDPCGAATMTLAGGATGEAASRQSSWHPVAEMRE